MSKYSRMGSVLCVSLGCMMMGLLFCCLGCHQKVNMVAVYPRTTATPLWETFHIGVADVAKDSKIRIYWNAPADDADTAGQLDFVSSYDRERYCGMILAPIDTMSVRSAVLERTQEHVPVVLVDDVEGPEPSQYLSYVYNDEVIGGRIAAERVAKILNGRGSIAVIGISGRLASASVRDDAFEKAIAQLAPHIEVRVRKFGDANVTHQQQIAQAIVDSPDPVNAIVALSAFSTRGAFYAKIATNPQSHIPLIGFDQDLLEPLQTGDIDAIVGQNMHEIGRRAMQNLLLEVHGKSTPGITTVPPLLITKENLYTPEIMSLWNYRQHNWGGL